MAVEIEFSDLGLESSSNSQPMHLLKKLLGLTHGMTEILYRDTYIDDRAYPQG